MNSYCRLAAARSRTFLLKSWCRPCVLATVAMLIVMTVPQPLGATDCGECDSSCWVANDPYALLEDYKKDKTAFAERSSRCSSSDPKWAEISDNINRVDPPAPPSDSSARRRPLSEFERVMIIMRMRVSGCMLLCGQERFQEDCFAGEGGKSCNCKPGAWPYCRAQAQEDARNIVAPDFEGSYGTSDGSAESTDPELIASGATEPEQDQESSDEARYMIEVAVSADGFAPDTVFAPCNIEPSSVTVSGRVIDDSGLGVSGARVTLVGLGATMTTDAAGTLQSDRPDRGRHAVHRGPRLQDRPSGERPSRYCDSGLHSVGQRSRV